MAFFTSAGSNCCPLTYHVQHTSTNLCFTKLILVRVLLFTYDAVVIIHIHIQGDIRISLLL